MVSSLDFKAELRNQRGQKPENEEAEPAITCNDLQLSKLKTCPALERRNLAPSLANVIQICT